MVNGVIIPHDGELAIRQETFASLREYQNAVGGYIEAISIEQPAMTMFANEEGKLQGLPVNRRATLLWWLLVPRARHQDVLCGDVALVGPFDDADKTLDLPKEMTRLLFQTHAFKIEVQTTDDRERWFGNGRVFDDFFEATANGLDLSGRWAAVEKVRVASAD